MSLPYPKITPIHNNQPDAVPSLWNIRYKQIDMNFDSIYGFVKKLSDGISSLTDRQDRLENAEVVDMPAREAAALANAHALDARGVAQEAKDRAINAQSVANSRADRYLGNLHLVGLAGQFLQKTDTGASWQNLPEPVDEEARKAALKAQESADSRADRNLSNLTLEGASGQMLFKTCEGVQWGDIPADELAREEAAKAKALAESKANRDLGNLTLAGSEGQVMTKRGAGVVWANSPDKADRDLGNLTLSGADGHVMTKRGSGVSWDPIPSPVDQTARSAATGAQETASKAQTAAAEAKTLAESKANRDLGNLTLTGSEGQVMTMSNGKPTWRSAPSTPTGDKADRDLGNLTLSGSEGQVMTMSNGKPTWRSAPSTPTGDKADRDLGNLTLSGSAGQVLTKTASGVAWASAPTTPATPTGDKADRDLGNLTLTGSEGQVLTMNGNKPTWKPVPVTVQDMSDFIRRSMSEPEVKNLGGGVTAYWYPVLKNIRYTFFIQSVSQVHKINFPYPIRSPTNAVAVVANTPNNVKHIGINVSNIYDNYMWVTTDSPEAISVDAAIEGFSDSRPW